MARKIKEIDINCKRLHALFDTGSMNTYITKRHAPFEKHILKYPFYVGLGGETREIKETCIIEGRIEGLGFSTDADIIDDIGAIDGTQIDIIIGARTMERWEIKLDPKTGELDLSGLKRREFTEY
ncbi:MAG: hypothetical protein ABIL66_00270 [candidate division WOR-3 bacterium]